MKDAYSFDMDEAGARDRPSSACLSLISAPSTRLGVVGIPMVRRHWPHRWRPQLRVPSSSPTTGESERVLPSRQGLWLEKTIPSMSTSTDFRGAAGRRSTIFKDWTSLFAATERDVRTRKASAPPCPRPTGSVAARGIEVGHIFYFGTKYSEPMRATVTGPDGKETCRCTWALTASGRRRLTACDHRGQPRRCGHCLARLGRAVRRSSIDQPQGRRCRTPTPPASQALCKSLLGAGRRHPLRRPRRPRPGAEVRHRSTSSACPYQVLILGPRGLKPTGRSRSSIGSSGEKRNFLSLDAALVKLKRLKAATLRSTPTRGSPHRTFDHADSGTAQARHATARTTRAVLGASNGSSRGRYLRSRRDVKTFISVISGF